MVAVDAVLWRLIVGCLASAKKGHKIRYSSPRRIYSFDHIRIHSLLRNLGILGLNISLSTKDRGMTVEEHHS